MDVQPPLGPWRDHMTRQLSLLFLAGCLPSVDPDKPSGTPFDSDSGMDSATPDDTGSAPRPYTQVLLSTIATDYSLGAVATVDIETGEVSDALATTSGDAVVRSTGGIAVVLNRFNTDSVRLYDGEDWSQPTLEFALADLSNPQDAVLCEDNLWVTQHNGAQITAHDPRTGLVVNSIDLSPWAGSDGSAEASGMLLDGETILVAVQQFDQDAGWTSEGGALLRFPCSGGDPVVVADIGPSPGIASGSTGTDLVMRTGLYGELDGSVVTIDIQTGSQAVLADETEMGRDITGVAMTPDHLVFITTTSDWIYQIHCQDRQTGARIDGPQSTAFWSDLDIDDRGRAWVATRTGWAPDSPAQGGLQIFDAATCEDISPGGALIRTTLNPYNLVFR